jgi:predicted metalloprotease
VRWGNMRGSDNVEDRESAGPASGIGGGLKLGGVGLIAVLAISWFLGLNPLDVLVSLQGGDSPSVPTQSAPPPSTSAPGPRDEGKEIIAKVLGDTEDTWNAIFKRMGREYRPPKLVLFRGAVDSACGLASSVAGPFYCSSDDHVYLDRSFFEELSKRFGAPGEFARAYVIAHEVGHHVQNQLGITDKVAQQRGRASQARSNALSVLVELQADCFAGIWGHFAKQRNLLDPGDVESGLAAAAAIGDDRIQQQSRGRVSPESFTHGSSAQRVRWFRSGLDSGDVNQCNTFETARP